MTCMVMSSIFQSYLYHASTAFLSRVWTASSALLRTKAGTTIYSTSSLEMNSHSPSEATTMNLSSILKHIYPLPLRNKLLLARLSLPLLRQRSLQRIGSQPIQGCSSPESKYDKAPSAHRLHPGMEISFLHSF